jgi:hypothetical protein
LFDRAPKAALRLCDWRFLLPTPEGVFEHLVLLGAPQARRNDSQSRNRRRVSEDVPPERCAER